MGNSKDERKLRRLLLRLGYSPSVKSEKSIKRTGTRNTKISQPLKLATNYLSRIPTVWKWIIAILTIPSLYIGLVSVVPIVTIEPQALLRKDQPFSFPIRVSNAGYIGINTIDLQCTVDVVAFGRFLFIRDLLHQATDFTLGDLARGGYATTFCGIPDIDQQNSAFSHGHITLLLSFRPDFSPFRVHRTFYLTGIPDDSAQAHWVLTSH